MGNPDDYDTKNMMEEQLQDTWETVGTRKQMYNCDSLHFPKMATESHISRAFLKGELDISLSRVGSHFRSSGIWTGSDCCLTNRVQWRGFLHVLSLGEKTRQLPPISSGKFAQNPTALSQSLASVL